MWYVGPGPLRAVAQQKKKCYHSPASTSVLIKSYYGVRITVCNASKMVNKQPWTANQGRASSLLIGRD